jgi:hypothetical protein
MNKPKLIAAALVISALAAASAQAQPIEIGAGVGRIGSWFAGPYDGADVRVGIPIDRGDVEIVVGAAPTARDRIGFYAVQYRQSLDSISSGGTRVFLTYGAGGFFSYETHDAFVAPPLLAFVGAGVEQRLLPRLAVRLDAQGVGALAIPVGVRIAAGISVPIGRLSANARTAAAR